jgi:addiction module HigA family antidote
MKVYDGEFPIAVHPGVILQEILEENGRTQAELARHLRTDPSKVNEICRGRRGISAETAIMLAKVLGISAGTWLNLQKNWEHRTSTGVERFLRWATSGGSSPVRTPGTASFAARPVPPVLAAGRT